MSTPTFPIQLSCIIPSLDTSSCLYHPEDHHEYKMCGGAGLLTAADVEQCIELSEYMLTHDSVSVTELAQVPGYETLVRALEEVPGLEFGLCKIMTLGLDTAIDQMTSGLFLDNNNNIEYKEEALEAITNSVDVQDTPKPGKKTRGVAKGKSQQPYQGSCFNKPARNSRSYTQTIRAMPHVRANGKRPLSNKHTFPINKMFARCMLAATDGGHILKPKNKSKAKKGKAKAKSKGSKGHKKRKDTHWQDMDTSA
ncbi:hypothetical protein CYLTODRAFT_415927 [Cylindrobasidium torrendii FP15055 ss-10]|uniref:Uncharacterized protein n=1 Tax=Cylindrobasidium torrendii FP15055 ss-10 TaxID=1314674 RepID=A0A0D7ATZ2_9AGAR|nr:hypothetical protein CYLTODRAFT_415927 [Cylindrobasidium torrendii FP15055 ss-10]